jgi:hypothetical protein
LRQACAILAQGLTETATVIYVQIDVTTPLVRHRDYAHQDLVPALGRVRLNELSYAHIAAFIRDQVAAEYGCTTGYRRLVKLSSALGEAMRRHRSVYDATRPAPVPGPSAAEWQV